MMPKSINTRQTAEPIVAVAPLGGLNGRDPRAAMDPRDAFRMDNAFPGTASIYSRNGCVKYTTQMSGAVQSLEVYAGATGDKMLAFASGSIYDVSTQNPVQLATGLIGNVVIAAMYSNAADTAQRLIMATGWDVVRSYDGVNITALNMTGVQGGDATSLNYVLAFKARLYFGQRNKLGFYYLPVGQIQGALSYFDLAQVSARGGYLVAIASFSESGNGNTPNDYIVFITSKGELIVYEGYDPSNASYWSLVGRYFAAPPVSPRCTINYGTELLILTKEGAVSFSEIRRAGSAQAAGVSGALYSAITSKLGALLTKYNNNMDAPGWSGLQYSSNKDGWLLLNVPTALSLGADHYQYVMNTTTNAWCRFTGWNGLCFAVYKRRLYFGRADGYVMLADEGKRDDGKPIPFDVQLAYSTFDDGKGGGALTKHFQWARLEVSCDGPAPLSGKFNVDYVDEQPEFIANTGTVGGEWDVALWDQALWGYDDTPQKITITLNREGIAGSLWLRAPLDGRSLTWYSTQYVLQRTQGLLFG